MSFASDKKWMSWFGGAALAGLLFLNPAAAGSQNQSQGTVGWVVDGDTFQLDTGEKIRLIGIDTPEYQPWKHRADFYGKEAFLYAKSLLKNKKVRLEKDAEEKDKYGRTLAYVYLEDGTFVNRLLVTEGYARARNYPPDSRYQKTLKEAEEEAKGLKKGLWAGKRLRRQPAFLDNLGANG